MNGFQSAFSLGVQILRMLTGPSGYGTAVWFLVGIFAWSGIAKLRWPALAALAMVDFGTIQRARPHFGFALGAGELFLSAWLAARIASPVAVSVAAALLWLFVLLIARSLWLGTRFACFCFGDTKSQLSRWTLVRTTALALLASALALAPTSGSSLGAVSGVSILQAITALSLLAIIVLLSYIPGLLQWNWGPNGTEAMSHLGDE